LSYRRVPQRPVRRRAKARGVAPRELPVPWLIERYQLSSLPVRRVLAAPRTELRQLEPVRIVLPVLGRRVRARPAGRARESDDRSVVLWHLSRPFHWRIFVATPAPTVLPPSRIAKRRPSSRAIGVMRVTSRLVLSPGMTISVPSLSLASPVTSVVRM